VDLLKQYHFPTAVNDIVQQHQGTTVKKYFYRQALEQGLDVREDDFRYPGPRPRSKEAAIVMMADTVEASTRTLKDRSTESIREHVHRMIQGFTRDGQLDECELSFHDLKLDRGRFCQHGGQHLPRPDRVPGNRPGGGSDGGCGRHHPGRPRWHPGCRRQDHPTASAGDRLYDPPAECHIATP